MESHKVAPRPLYIFNPDTDYALASGSRFYTPPARVASMRRDMALFPALWAEPESIILCPYGSPAPHTVHPDISQAIAQKKLTILLPHQIDRIRLMGEPELCINARPWGWDPAICHMLEDLPFHYSTPLPSDWDRRKQMAHRRHTISLCRHLAGQLPEWDIPLPQEIFTEEEAAEKYRQLRTLFFKDPWSSAGRGICHTRDLTEEQTRQWCRGAIRRHGSVMAETAADKATDCASLWHISDREVRFLGFSLFETSPRGKYKGQVLPDKDGCEAMRHLLPFIADPELGHRLTEAQQQWLEMPENRMNGYLSIDMLVENNGNVRPGIEINRRMTMGIAALLATGAYGSPLSAQPPHPFIRYGQTESSE